MARLNLKKSKRKDWRSIRRQILGDRHGRRQQTLELCGRIKKTFAAHRKHTVLESELRVGRKEIEKETKVKTVKTQSINKLVRTLRTEKKCVLLAKKDFLQKERLRKIVEGCSTKCISVLHTPRHTKTKTVRLIVAYLSCLEAPLLGPDMLRSLHETHRLCALGKRTTKDMLKYITLFAKTKPVGKEAKKILSLLSAVLLAYYTANGAVENTLHALGLFMKGSIQEMLLLIEFTPHTARLFREGCPKELDSAITQNGKTEQALRSKIKTAADPHTLSIEVANTIRELADKYKKHGAAKAYDGWNEIEARFFPKIAQRTKERIESDSVLNSFYTEIKELAAKNKPCTERLEDKDFAKHIAALAQLGVVGLSKKRKIKVLLL
ncbi:MAG: uncharacterized protein A8A55_2551 [Amphiamblys sp. WSBS2006]|nr:MAG: uncharacterized protein A8A55_2551 [Amphiamblys sp. WSBS2006]